MAPASDAFDVVVVGGGIVGLACASALSRAGRHAIVLERHAGIGREVTSRNSEVVHAGLYYPPGTLKARTCVDGRRALEARCARESIGYRRLGKWIVAHDGSEIAKLEALLARGTENGVEGLELRDARALREAEPDVVGEAALWSPATGIVDGHGLALSHAAEIEREGGAVLLERSVVAIDRRDGPGRSARWRLEVEVGAAAERDTLDCAALVNCAGLAADSLAEWAGIDVEAHDLRQHPCKGDYFSLAPRSPLRFRSLIYPVPPETGLGVHATLDLGGRVRFGPDAEFVDAPRFDVDPAKAASFAAAIARYAPGVRAEDLRPDTSGVRPRLATAGERFRDFEVREESAIGCPGLVNCVGIESPGLTASEAIGEHVAALLASL